MNMVHFEIAASFGWFNNEYSSKVGSLQVLVELSDYVRGFNYGWIPFSVCGQFGQKEWIPVYVDYPKGIISPCVVDFDGKQILGKVSYCLYRSAWFLNDLMRPLSPSASSQITSDYLSSALVPDWGEQYGF